MKKAVYVNGFRIGTWEETDIIEVRNRYNEKDFAESSINLPFTLQSIMAIIKSLLKSGDRKLAVVFACDLSGWDFRDAQLFIDSIEEEKK